MKAISLWQPWASLIAAGLKPYETRDWFPPAKLIGQKIAIHAAKKVDKGAAQFAEEIMYGQHADLGHAGADKISATFNKPGDFDWANLGMAPMPVGCVVATAKLAAAFKIGDTAREGSALTAKVTSAIWFYKTETPTSIRIDDFGDYSPGRWAWLLTDVKAINPPAPVKGAQGFFDLPQGWLTATNPAHEPDDDMPF